MSFLEDIFDDVVDYVEDEVIEPAAHFVKDTVGNLLSNPWTPLMIVGGVAVAALAPEFLPALLPAIEGAEAGVAVSEAVAIATAEDVGLGAVESAALEEFGLGEVAAESVELGAADAEAVGGMEEFGLGEESAYDAYMNNADPGAISQSLRAMENSNAISSGSVRQSQGLTSTFQNLRNKAVDVASRAAKVTAGLEAANIAVDEADKNYHGRRDDEHNGEPTKPAKPEPSKPEPNEPQPSPTPANPGNEDLPGGQTNRNLHELGLWKADQAQPNFTTTPLRPRDFSDDPMMGRLGSNNNRSQSTYFDRKRQRI